MDNKEVDKALADGMRKGTIAHKGFDKNGEDLFSISDFGIEKVEVMLLDNPDSVMFLLKVAQSHGNEKFYKMLKHLSDLIEKKK